MTTFSVIIPARNAESTLPRALSSLNDPRISQIILVDDWSEDATRSVARGFADRRLKIVSPPEHRNLAYARNCGLEEVSADWLVWCDADDAFEPGRVNTLASLIDANGADCASDGVCLFDGKSGRFLRDLLIPEFLSPPGCLCRLFERNYLPGVGQIAVRTQLAKDLRYDEGLTGGDDYDFALRLVRSGASFALASTSGYRMFAYPDSDSRHLSRQNSMVAKALRKHEYSEIAQLYRLAGLSDRVTAWALCSMAIFRGEYRTAIQFLDQGFPVGSSPFETLEPSGPFPIPEGWRHSFTRGTLELLVDRPREAIPWLAAAETIRSSPEALNNLGVALFRQSRPDEAEHCFEQALQRFPGYLDAILNLRSGHPDRITRHILRVLPSRDDYSPAYM